jgi:hypothetical protein
MLGGLRQDDIRPDLAATVLQPLDHGRGGFVASRLDSEYNHPALILRVSLSA